MTALVDRPAPSLDFHGHRRARRRRRVVVTTLLAVLALVLFAVTLSIGSYTVSLPDVVASVLHVGGNPAADYVVQELRLPTALTALAAGVALGVAGSVFQQLLANPLASPDFVGVSSGASLFAVASLTVVDVGVLGVSGAALVGALASAGLIYLLAWKDGIAGYRFILIGIGVQQLMLSLVGYVIMKADLSEAQAAMTWLVGSVGQAGTTEVRVLVATVIVLLPVALVLERRLGVLELGDDTARGLGASVERARLALIGVAIVLVAVSVAAAGPIPFVALVAGPIARRLVGPGAGSLLASGLIGAALLLASDLVASHVLPSALPTGVVTGAVGAPYLIWLLATVNKEGRGG